MRRKGTRLAAVSLACAGLVVAQPRPAWAFVGIDTAAIVELTAQLVQQMSVLKQMLETSKATLQAAKTSAELAHESLRRVTDSDDHVAAPEDLFGFRQGEAPVAPSAQAAALAKLPDPLAARRAGDASGGLQDPWRKGPLHHLANRLDKAHGQAVARLRRQMDYLQQSGEGMLDKLSKQGWGHLDAMRSLARNGMVGATAAMESAVSLEHIYQHQQVKQLFDTEDQVMALKERAVEVRGMAVEVGHEARAFARAVRHGRPVPDA